MKNKVGGGESGAEKRDKEGADAKAGGKAGSALGRFWKSSEGEGGQAGGGGAEGGQGGGEARNTQCAEKRGVR